MSGDFLYFAAFGVLTILVFQVAAVLFDALLRRVNFADAIVAKRNGAAGIEQAGRAIGAFMIAASVVKGCVGGVDVLHDVAWTAAFGFPAVVLLVVVGRLSAQVLLRARIAGEIARNNTAAGIAVAAHDVATAIVIARCLHGNSVDTLGVSLAFLAIALVTLNLFIVAFRVITTYADSEEVLDNNVAAALSYAGITVALGIIIAHAAEGDFVSWEKSLGAYGLALAFAAALYPVRQVIVEAVILRAGFSLRGGRLDREIAEQRNIGVGAVEAAAYVGVALFVVSVA
ncbi:MAG: DUF350 domain-containing protein [Deltaproteobacteria bacterium]|nr:DUF350 domain-containing protein [Deltaproteobacteria bacterium]